MQVPLDAVDLQHVSLLYTQGEMAAVAPIYDYDFRMLTEMVSEASWRQLLFWLGPPGLLIGALALLTLKEPRSAKVEKKKKPGLGSRFRLPFMSGVPPEPSQSKRWTCCSSSWNPSDPSHALSLGPCYHLSTTGRPTLIGSLSHPPCQCPCHPLSATRKPTSGILIEYQPLPCLASSKGVTL